MLPKNRFLVGSVSFISIIIIFSVLITKCRPLSSSEYVALAKEKRSNFKGYSVEEVLRYYHKAIEIDPNNIDAYNGRGDILSTSRSDYEYPYYSIGRHGLDESQNSALDDFNRAIEIRPNAESYTRRAWSKTLKFLYYTSSRGLGNVGCAESEEKDISKAIEIDPNYSDAYYLQGLCDYHFNEQKALEDLNKAIEINPNNIEAYSFRALMKSSFEHNEEALTHNKGALADYDQMIKIEPNNAESYESRGEFKKNLLKDNRGALSDYEQALNLYQEQGRTQKIDLMKSKIRTIKSDL